MSSWVRRLGRRDPWECWGCGELGPTSTGSIRKSQLALNNVPLCPQVAHCRDTVASNHGLLNFQAEESRAPKPVAPQNAGPTPQKRPRSDRAPSAQGPKFSAQLVRGRSFRVQQIVICRQPGLVGSRKARGPLHAPDVRDIWTMRRRSTEALPRMSSQSWGCH